MTAQRKLFLGARLKRLRRERGLNQSAMAGELGISASYLNHLERNQRPVTAGVLLRLAEAFDVDMQGLRRPKAATRAASTQLAEIFADPMLADLGVQPLRAGRAGRQCARGRRGGRAALHRPPRAAAPAGDGRRRRADPRALITPETWVRDYIQAQRNHFPSSRKRRRDARRRARRTRCRSPSRCASASRRRAASTSASSPPEMLEDASQHYDLQRRG